MIKTDMLGWLLSKINFLGEYILDDINFNAKQKQVLQEIVRELYRLSDTFMSIEELCQEEILGSHDQSKICSDMLLKKFQNTVKDKKLP